MSAILGSIPWLYDNQTYKLLHNFVGVVAGTPTWALLVDGVQVAQGDGVLVSGSQWRFDVVVPPGQTAGESAQVSVKATVDSSPVDIEYNSGIVEGVKLIEIGKKYRHTQDAQGSGVTQADKWAEATVSEAV